MKLAHGRGVNFPNIPWNFNRFNTAKEVAFIYPIVVHMFPFKNSPLYGAYNWKK
ncbi:MAG TPA: hypothetical protein ACFYEA_08625 [Candidatus Tripitaka californicus]|uniref:hypothetical protein n=1 Tax=Candidatus Tripitaka californicus TaxID=3367616 RepID=UPI00402A230C